ncbi:hypothetical protein MHU86_24156 [Fragilaria crotonensis]|nr:hypothetical protein MHU86_24156 [Fragilaria crotonensis]
MLSVGDILIPRRTKRRGRSGKRGSGKKVAHRMSSGKGGSGKKSSYRMSNGKGGSGKGGTHSSGKSGYGSSETSSEDDGGCHCKCHNGQCTCQCESGRDSGNGGKKGNSGESGKIGNSGKGGKKGNSGESSKKGNSGESGKKGNSGNGGKKGNAGSGSLAPSTPPPTSIPEIVLPPSLFVTTSPTSAPTKELFRTVSCEGFVPEQAVALDVPYRYQVTIDESLMDIDEAREIIEKAFLDSVAKELVVCDDEGGGRGLSSGGGVAVSALPEDKSCGNTCTEGGMTVFVPESESNSTESQCRALATMNATIADILAENPGITSITLPENEDLQCDNESDTPPPVSVVSMNSAEPSFPVAGVTAGAVAAALFALLAFFVLRRRRKPQARQDVVHVWSPDGGATEAYKCGYRDGYAYRVDEFKAGRQNKDDSASVCDDMPTRTELEGNAFVLGFNLEDSIDAYCNGFRDGYDAASADLIHTTCDVHKCNSARCELCRKDTKPQFQPLVKEPDCCSFDLCCT